VTDELGGEPAFPTAGTSHRLPGNGMTRRQYYAGQALVGLLAGRRHFDWSEDADQLTRAAWVLADDLLRNER
jgi:hypothetical protein